MKHFPAPHITIYLDATPEQCFSRIQKRGRVSTFVEVYIYVHVQLHPSVLHSKEYQHLNNYIWISACSTYPDVATHTLLVPFCCVLVKGVFITHVNKKCSVSTSFFVHAQYNYS